MNVYGKLAKARESFHQLEMKKSGHNKFANYYYFELADFVKPGMKCLQEQGLVPVISFDAAEASMTIYETDGEGSIRITSPMSSAALKGCHDVQNLGAVQTYLRRYLWTAAMEIIEQDALDSSKPQQAEKAQPPAPSESLVASFESCSTMDELKALWGEISEAERKSASKLKDQAKARLSA